MLDRAGGSLDDRITAEHWEEEFQAGQQAQAVLNSIVDRIAPDIMVVFGDDQKEQFHDDNMPMFSVYRGASMSRGGRQRQRDVWAAEAGKPPPTSGSTKLFEGAPELAEHLIDRLVESGVDIATSNQLRDDIGLGHAFTHVAENMPRIGETAILPFMVNTYYPPNQPTAARCYQLGRFIRQAIDDWDSDKRVAIVASGGLSHQIIDEPLNHGILAAMVAKDADWLCSLPRSTFTGGTSEILNWITVVAAMEPEPMTVVDYIPAYRTPAGTGLAMGFAYWE